VNLRDVIFWKPNRDKRLAVVAFGVVLTSLIYLLHTVTGPAYEFHIFFSLPVSFVTWYAGAFAGYALAALAVSLWLIADRELIGVQADPLPLLFNTSARLLLNVGAVWLILNLQRLLKRERRLAREDPLTGLANRREFFEQGRRALAQAERRAAPFTAAFIDLDRFKEVNDRLGHDAGDAVLRCVANELQGDLRTGDVVGRLGGDEFALLMPGMDSAKAGPCVETLRQRLLAVMRAHDWPVSFSIGVASYGTAPESLDAVLTTADGLMYGAKDGGRDRILLRAFDTGDAGSLGSSGAIR